MPAATPPPTPGGPPDLRALFAVVKRHVGIDLSHYGSEQLTRRLLAWIDRATKGGTVEDYVRLVRFDQEAIEQLLDYLAINVTEFFRNSDAFNDLRFVIAPVFVQRALQHTVRIWSAGCSTGAEAYGLAMLLDAAGITKYTILGTDIDRGALQRAQDGGPYPANEVREVPLAYRKRYLREAADHTWWVENPTIKQAVKIKRHDLISDPCEANFDLVVCRNVIIYFTEDKKVDVRRRLVQSLRVGGFFFTGATELLIRPKDFGLRHIGSGIYERLV